MKKYLSILSGILGLAGICSGQDETIGAGEVFNLGSADQLSLTSFTMETNSLLSFGVSTDGSGTPFNGLISAGTATLNRSAGIHLVSEVGAMDLDEIYTSKLLETDTLVFLLPNAVTNWSGPIYNSDFDLQNYIQLVQSNYLMQTTFYIADTDLYVDFGRVSIANAAGLEKGTDLWEVAEVIDQLGDGTDPVATAQVNLLNGMNGAEQQRQLRQLYETELPHHSHQKIILSGIDITGSRSVAFRSARRIERKAAEEVPEGTFGLHFNSQPVRPWSKVYGSHGSRIDEGDYEAYDHNIVGGIMGVDKGIGNLLIGAAGGLGSSHMRSSDKSYADMAYGVLYTSWGTERWFANASLSYGVGSVDTESGTSFDVEGDFSIDTTAAYAGFGREIWLAHEHAVITPEFGLGSSIFRQDAYTETGTTGLPRSIDEYEHWSIRPTLGFTVSWPYEDIKFRCEPRVRAFWTGELNDDIESVDYTIANDPDAKSLYVRGSEPGYFTFGAGAAFIRDDGWEFAADLNSHFGELSTLEISLKAGYMF